MVSPGLCKIKGKPSSVVWEHRFKIGEEEEVS